MEDCSLHKMTHSEMDDTVTHCDFNTRDVSLLGSNHIHGTANAQHRTCLYTQFCSRFYKLIIKECGNYVAASLKDCVAADSLLYKWPPRQVHCG